jgi:hypothetical protein
MPQFTLEVVRKRGYVRIVHNPLRTQRNCSVGPGTVRVMFCFGSFPAETPPSSNRSTDL